MGKATSTDPSGHELASFTTRQARNKRGRLLGRAERRLKNVGEGDPVAWLFVTCGERWRAGKDRAS